MKLTCKQYGNKGILVTWPAEIDTLILEEMNHYLDAVQNQIPDILSVRQAYHEVYIEFKNKVTPFSEIQTSLLDLYENLKIEERSDTTLWHIPVCYDDDLAPDQKDYLRSKNISQKSLIDLHTAPIYTVHFIGFLPGFIYLGGMNEALTLDRKSTPSRLITKGTVAIGGRQTGIYPCDSPGGWHGIGYTPVSFFDKSKQRPTWAKPGDKLKYYAIDQTQLAELKAQIQANTFQLKNEKING